MAKLKEKQLTVKSEGAGAKLLTFVAGFVMDALKDYLEELMDLKRVATIRFRTVEGAVSTVKGHVVKMETVSGRDIMETDAGFVIGADQILEINGRQFENIC